MSVTLHTTLGDIKIEIFCESVPKTAEASFVQKSTLIDPWLSRVTELPGPLRLICLR